MGVESFNIVFDSPSSAYYAGQVVSGRVVLGVSNSERVRALKINITGKAETRFQTKITETQRNESSNELDYVTGEETFFEYNYNILGGNIEVEIPWGNHTYPFNATLPVGMPSSFGGEYGSIQYKVTATLDRPWKSDERAVGTFTVVAPLDLNLYEQAKAPVKREDYKYFCCLCCKSGPLTMVLSLPYTGFVAGGQLPFTIEVDNASNVEVPNVKVEILKIVTYKAKVPHRAEITESSSISKVELAAVGTNDSKTWNQMLSIPSGPFHNLTTCSIIVIRHVLKAVVVVSGAHLNLETEIPLTMGSAPFVAPLVSPQHNLNMEKVNPEMMQPSGFNANTVPFMAVCPSAPPNYIPPTFSNDFNPTA